MTYDDWMSQRIEELTNREIIDIALKNVPSSEHESVLEIIQRAYNKENLIPINKEDDVEFMILVNDSYKKVENLIERIKEPSNMNRLVKRILDKKKSQDRFAGSYRKALKTASLKLKN